MLTNSLIIWNQPARRCREQMMMNNDKHRELGALVRKKPKTKELALLRSDEERTEKQAYIKT